MRTVRREKSGRGEKIFIDMVLILLLATIPFLFQGREVIFNSIIDVCIDPLYYLKRVFYLWNSQELAGVTTNWGSSLLFPFGSFFALFSFFHLPAFLVERAWFVLILFMSGASMYFLMRVITLTRYRFARLASVLFYMYNLYVFIGMQGASVLLLPYSILPLMLGAVIRGLSERKYLKAAVVIGLASTLMSLINPPLALGAILVLGFYLLYDLFFWHRKWSELWRVIRLVATTLIVTIALNFWIILPIVYYLKTAHGIETASIFSEKLTWINSGSSYLETFRLLGIWYFYLEGAPGVMNFSYAPLFRYHPLFVGTSFALPVLAFSAFLLKKPRSRYPGFFAILALLAIPLSVGIYPPERPSLLGRVYLWAYQNVPLFNVFKDNYRPFVGMIALSYAVLLGFTVIRFSVFFKKKVAKLIQDQELKKRIHLVPACLIMGITIINSISVFAGNMFYEKMKIEKIPDYWYESADWLNQQEEDFRIFFLPEQRFALYEWGHTAGEPAAALYKKSQIYSVASVAERANIRLINYLYEAVNRVSAEGLANLAGLMNVRYFLQRNDFDWELSVREIPPQTATRFISSQSGINLEKSFGKLDFYRVSDEFFRPLFYSTSQIVFLSGDLTALPEVLTMEGSAKLAIYQVAEKTQDEANQSLLARAKSVYVEANLEDNIPNEEIGRVIRPEKIYLPALKWAPDDPVYSIVVKKEEFEKWRVRNDPEALIQAKLFYATKRIAEIEKWGTNEEDIEQSLKKYESEMIEVLEILGQLKKEEDPRFLPLLTKVEGFVWGCREELEKNGGESWESWIDVSQELTRRVSLLQISHDFDQLVYTFEIPTAGRYQIFMRDGEQGWSTLEERDLEAGTGRLTFPISRLSENLIESHLGISDYRPDSIYRLSFDYRNNEEDMKFFVAEGRAGKVFETIIPVTGDDYEHFETYFRSSAEVRKATVFLPVQEEMNLEVRRISQPELVLKLVKPFPLVTDQPPEITFTRLNPTKYQIGVRGATGPYVLVFSESYHPDWRIFLANDDSEPSGILSYFRNNQIGLARELESVAKERHDQVNSFANSWYIVPDDVEGRTDYDLIVEFWPQRLFHLGLVVSAVSLAGCLGYLIIISVFKRKYREDKRSYKKRSE